MACIRARIGVQGCICVNDVAKKPTALCCAGLVRKDLDHFFAIFASALIGIHAFVSDAHQ